MRYVFLAFILIVISGCASQQANVEQVSDNSFVITAQGPASEGIIVLKNKIHLAARDVCLSRYYEFSQDKFGESIKIEGRTSGSSNGSWHNNESTTLEASARVTCQQG